MAPDERTPHQIVLAARPDLERIEQELDEAGRRLADPALAGDLDRMDRVLRRQAVLLEEFEQAGGHAFEGRARSLLLQLGLDEAAIDRPSDVRSGGQRKLIALAACLAAEPDLLLLDEPETHLDAEARSRLEDLIRGFDGAVVMVSHDRYLLDETVTEIAELDGGRIRIWPGNYSTYAAERELELERQQQQYVTQQKEIARLEEAIRRFKLWASIVVNERHIKQARNKQRQIDRMDKIDRPVLERRKMALRLRSAAARRPARGRAARCRHRPGRAADPDRRRPDRDARRADRRDRRQRRGQERACEAADGRAGAHLGQRWIGPSIEMGLLAQDHDDAAVEHDRAGGRPQGAAPARRARRCSC